MPTIVKIGNIKIQIFADDHNPPYFHVRTPDGKALVRIGDLTIMAGNIDRLSLSIASPGCRKTERYWKMSGSASMRNDRVIVREALPDIAAAAPLDGRKIRVTWDSGETQIVDIAPALASKRIFVRLRTDDELFRTLRVNEDGNAIIWDDGAELTAVWIDRLASLSFDNADFRDAMDRLELSLDGMAAALGTSRRLIADYRKDKPIPNHIGLAVRYLLHKWASKKLAALGGTDPTATAPPRRRWPARRL